MKPIKDYEDYFISESGEVWSKKYSKLRLLKQADDGRGYRNITLYAKSVKKIYKVHRLVAQAYIPNPHNLPLVDHKDDNKSNNNVTNLQWITDQGNNEKAHAKTHLVEVVATGNIITVYNILKWCKDNNLSDGALYETKTGKRGQYKGFRLLS